MEETRRLQFDQELRDILGTTNVYFQPPTTLQMKYPCIIYFKTSLPARYANNLVYQYKQGYTVTYVSKDPDDEKPYDILKHFQYAKPDSFYKSENLNHTKLTIFY